jgi:prolyl 4-hydroxylase
MANAATVLHELPRIYVVDDVLDPGECAHVIGLGRPQLADAMVSGDSKGRQSQGRTNRLAWVRHDTDAITSRACGRIAEIVGLPLENAESMQVIRYDESQRYKPHYDAYDLETERGQRCCARGGQRMATALVYLDDVTAGGETGFPRLDIQVQAKRGRLLVFHNCHPDSTVRHPDTLHEGCPVLVGTKWAFNLWFHERAWG